MKNYYLPNTHEIPYRDLLANSKITVRQRFLILPVIQLNGNDSFTRINAEYHRKDMLKSVIFYIKTAFNTKARVENAALNPIRQGFCDLH